ncbi:MAG: hypothetical protein Q4F05_13705 [bacterium]|nr:hypothetical protein [bacterium]
MKKKSISLILVIVTMIACCIGLTGCAQDTAFSGSCLGNENQFLLDFTILNTTQHNQMYLEKGEQINTTIEITKGNVDILVKNENGAVAYQGNDVSTSSFLIGIKETGTYTFEVTGQKAEGSVHFVKN